MQVKRVLVFVWLFYVALVCDILRVIGIGLRRLSNKILIKVVREESRCLKEWWEFRKYLGRD